MIRHDWDDCHDVSVRNAPPQSCLIMVQTINALISGDVADFQAQGLAGACNGGVPKRFGLLAVAGHETFFVNLDLPIRMPRALAVCAIQTEPFDKFQTVRADLNRLERRFFARCGRVCDFPVILAPLLPSAKALSSIGVFGPARQALLLVVLADFGFQAVTGKRHYLYRERPSSAAVSL